MTTLQIEQFSKLLVRQTITQLKAGKDKAVVWRGGKIFGLDNDKSWYNGPGPKVQYIELLLGPQVNIANSGTIRDESRLPRGKGALRLAQQELDRRGYNVRLILRTREISKTMCVEFLTRKPVGKHM